MAPATAGAVTLAWVLDSVGESPCGSRLRPVQAVNATCYDTFDDLTPSTGTELLLNIDAPSLEEIEDGDAVTLHGWFLPLPTNGDSFHSLDIDFSFTFLTLGLENLGTPQSVVPDPFYVIGELVGSVQELSPGVFAVDFPTLPIYWAGERPFTGQSGDGVLPFTLSTVQSFIDVTSTTPAVPGVSPEIPGFCTGGNPIPPGVGYPIFPLPSEGSDFTIGSRFALGGATCPSGLNAVTSLGERAFSIELQGMLMPPVDPECSDGIDNDGDGWVDFVGGDPDCDDALDDSEWQGAGGGDETLSTWFCIGLDPCEPTQDLEVDWQTGRTYLLSMWAESSESDSEVCEVEARGLVDDRWYSVQGCQNSAVGGAGVAECSIASGEIAMRFGQEPGPAPDPTLLDGGGPVRLGSVSVAVSCPIGSVGCLGPNPIDWPTEEPPVPGTGVFSFAPASGGCTEARDPSLASNDVLVEISPFSGCGLLGIEVLIAAALARLRGRSRSRV